MGSSVDAAERFASMLKLVHVVVIGGSRSGSRALMAKVVTVRKV